MYRKQDFIQQINSPLKKVVSFGQSALGLGLTLKSAYDVGSRVFAGARAIAPVVAGAAAAIL